MSGSSPMDHRDLTQPGTAAGVLSNHEWEHWVLRPCGGLCCSLRAGMSLLGQGVTALSQHTEPGSCVTHPVHTGAGRDFVSDLNPSSP